MEQPLVSIIVPVYKVEKYLDRCVDSLVRQTYQRLQIVLVDDGSPDGCPHLCNEWGGKDARITVVHRPNGGLSAARNTGIDHASGEYVAFVDSDDYVDPAYVQAMVEAAQSHDADLVVSGFVSNRPGLVGQNVVPSGVYSGKDLLVQAIHAHQVPYVVAWDKLYRFALVDAIRFPEGKIHEDEYTFYRFFAAAKTVAVIDRPLYHYELNGDSIMGNLASLKHLDRVEAYLDRAVFFASHGYEALVDDAMAGAEFFFMRTLSLSKVSKVVGDDRVMAVRNNMLDLYSRYSRLMQPETVRKYRHLQHNFAGTLHMARLRLRVREFIKHIVRR